ncbi:MAG: NAD(P)H-dependent oxidoreductase [archaeon]|nr:NAD(P)H-dependent oxidoreductase [archaeon]MCR4323556.1 NAD(P)H-dependent oxidoreductase [Nanoarchaeota archaeon]
MKKKVLIIVGHPKRNSLSSSISKSYYEGAVSSGNLVKELHLRDLKFDPILWDGYSNDTHLESDIKKSQKLIKWADHLVFIYPVWWHTMPALMKGWMDKVFLPSFGFKYEKGMRKPTRLLTGKTAEIIKTSGGPWWLHGLPGPTDNLLWKFGTFGFMGIKMKLFGVTHFSKIRIGMSNERFEKIMKKARKLGERV